MINLNMEYLRRRKRFERLVLMTTVVLHNDATQATDDPCLSGNHKNLTDVRRSVSYQTAYPESPLCDYDLIEGWYRFMVDADSKMSETCPKASYCGTTVPIWMRGTHPSTNDGIQTRQACANFQNGGASYTECCGQTMDIRVKNCGEYFVYYLYSVPACPMAYCAGKDAPCPAGTWSPTGFPPGCKEVYPQLTDPPRLRGPVIERNTFYFTCDLTFSGNDPDQAFEFVWLFDGVEDPKVPPEVVSEPGRSARLDGAKLAGLLNKNIGCKVRGFFKRTTIKAGFWLESPRTYWAGIQTEPSSITTMTNEDRKDVMVKSTVPVLCDSRFGADEFCCLRISISEGGPDTAPYPIVWSCRYLICMSAWNTTLQEVSVTFPVIVPKTAMQDGNKDLLVSFASLVVAEPSPYQQIFQGLKIPSVHVRTETRNSKLCSISDQHITGLEDKRLFSLYKPGDYTAYENIGRHFEVQIRTWPCYRERADRAVTCVCGVAVREKDDLIRVNGCNHGFYGRSVGSPEITVPRPLREGTRITQARDGSQISLYFPSSSQITINTSSGHLSLNISVPGKDYMDGRGLCGTFDNNPTNELTHRSGFVDKMPSDGVPESFTESWKNDDRTSLFQSLPQSLGDSYAPDYCWCSEDDFSVNCNYRRTDGDCIVHDNCTDYTILRGFSGTSWDIPLSGTDTYPQLTDPPSLRGPVIERNTFYFTCDLTFSGNDTDQVFEFVWLFNGLEDPKVPPEIVPFTVRSARLEGSKLTGLLNKNIGCKVRGFFNRTADIRGPWLQSTTTYWAGIRAEPSSITIRADEDRKDLTIKSTLPIVCDSPSTPDYLCCLLIDISVDGPFGNRLVLSNACKYKLCTSSWSSTRQAATVTVSVVARMTTIQDGTKTLLLSFPSLVVTDANPYLQIYQGLKITSVQVDLEQRESKMCSIVTVVSITGLENKRIFHLHRVGDYTAYENIQRDFEVQIRTWPCNTWNSNMVCVCGVAVREKDDLIRINGCNHGFYGPSVGSPEITVPRPLREGTTILQSTDGSMITIYFPSSSEIKVTASSFFGGLLNLEISVPGTDYLKGKGLCGTFDNNPNNELTHRDGFVDIMPADSVPESFTESWKNNANSSLFRMIPPEKGEWYVPGYCTCNNGGRGTVNCTDHGDIMGHKLTCPNCPEVTSKTVFAGSVWGPQGRKRSVSGKAHVDSDDIHQAYDPNDYAAFRPPKLSWPTSTGISESQAENYCSTALRQSQLWSHCQDKRQEIQGLIDNCKIDIQVADNYTGLEAIVNDFVTICKVELAKDPDNYVATFRGESILMPEISDDVCNPVCFINGHCNMGNCVCSKGFIGDNCQIKDELPTLSSIHGSSLCDYNEKPCRKVFINAANIQNTETMACKVQEILDDGSVSESFSKEEAVFLTLNKLGCRLPDAGIKTEKSIKRFYITATIDGHRYSNAVNVTVYDSSCQNCTQEGCQKLPNTCLIDNLCFQDGELNPKNNSQICTVTISATEWSPVPTVPSDYPVIMSVNVSRSEDNTQLRCEVNADASNPTASFRVAWGIDGDWRQESVLPSGHLEAAISMSDVRYADKVACRARSVFTDRGVFSPYTVSNIFSMAGL